MVKMLVATPLSHRPIGSETRKPRVISEIKKVTPKTALDHLQPRISGELLYFNGATCTWSRRHVQVRGGTLLITAQGAQNEPPRIALRHLNLRPGPTIRTFALYSRDCDNQPIATFQAANQHEYDIWVKIISIELMRQTPLEAIKYLDIMGLVSSPTSSFSSTSCRSRRSSSSDRSDSTISPTITKRRCRSELRLDVSRTDLQIQSKEMQIYSSSDEDYNSNKNQSCADCAFKSTVCKSLFPDLEDSGSQMSLDTVDGSSKTDLSVEMTETPVKTPLYLSHSYDVNRNLTHSMDFKEFQKRQARDRIRRVLSLKQLETTRSETESKDDVAKEPPVRPTLRKFDFGTIGYSRVYNVRDCVQLKSYDLKNINTSSERLSTKRKNDAKLNMLRKSTNTLADKDILNCSTKPITPNGTTKEYFTLTDYKSRHSKSLMDSIFPPSKPEVVTRHSSLTPTAMNGEKFFDVQSDEEAVEILLQRCQNSDSYVPVKEKLILFESLSRLGRRLARSSEDLVSLSPSLTGCHKRARSLHDLSRCGSAVREICKYFETRSEPEVTTSSSSISTPITKNCEALVSLNKYNTIAKGYRKVISTKDTAHNLKNNDKLNDLKKDYKSSFFHENSNYYFGFKQFREGNKIISYV